MNNPNIAATREAFLRHPVADFPAGMHRCTIDCGDFADGRDTHGILIVEAGGPEGGPGLPVAPGELQHVLDSVTEKLKARGYTTEPVARQTEDDDSCAACRIAPAQGNKDAGKIYDDVKDACRAVPVRSAPIKPAADEKRRGNPPGAGI